MFTVIELQAIIDMANRVPVQGLEAMSIVYGIASKAKLLLEQPSTPPVPSIIPEIEES